MIDVRIRNMVAEFHHHRFHVYRTRHPDISEKRLKRRIMVASACYSRKHDIDNPAWGNLRKPDCQPIRDVKYSAPEKKSLWHQSVVKVECYKFTHGLLQSLT